MSASSLPPLNQAHEGSKPVNIKPTKSRFGDFDTLRRRALPPCPPQMNGCEEGKTPRVHSTLKKLANTGTVTKELVDDIHAAARKHRGNARLFEKELANRLKDDRARAYRYLEEATQPTYFACCILLYQKEEADQLSVFKELVPFLANKRPYVLEEDLPPQEKLLQRALGTMKSIDGAVSNEKNGHNAIAGIAFQIKGFPQDGFLNRKFLEKAIQGELESRRPDLICAYYKHSVDSDSFFLRQTLENQKRILIELMEQEVKKADLKVNPPIRESTPFVKTWRVYARHFLNLEALCEKLVKHAENCEEEDSFFERGLTEIFDLEIPDSLTYVLKSFHRKLGPSQRSIAITHALLFLRYINAIIVDKAVKLGECPTQRRLIALTQKAQEICNNDRLPEEYKKVDSLDFQKFREQYISPIEPQQAHEAPQAD